VGGNCLSSNQKEGKRKEGQGANSGGKRSSVRPLKKRNQRERGLTEGDSLLKRVGGWTLLEAEKVEGVCHFFWRGIGRRKASDERVPRKKRIRLEGGSSASVIGGFRSAQRQKRCGNQTRCARRRAQPTHGDSRSHFVFEAR